MSAPGLHHRKPHLVSSELPRKALTNFRPSACVVLCWPDGHWTPQTPNSSSPVKTTAPAAPQPTTTAHSTCTPYLQLPEARTPIFRPPTGISPASCPSLFYSSAPSTPIFRLISSVHGRTLAFHRSSAVDLRDSNCHRATTGPRPQTSHRS